MNRTSPTTLALGALSATLASSARAQDDDRGLPAPRQVHEREERRNPTQRPKTRGERARSAADSLITGLGGQLEKDVVSERVRAAGAQTADGRGIAELGV